MTTRQPVQATASTTISVAANTVYDMVSDVTRMGEWSPETVTARWLDGASGPQIGARFVGTNVIGSLKWSTTVPNGTRVTVSVSQQRPSPWIIRLLQRRAGITDRSEHLRAGMAVTLQRLRAAAEQSAPLSTGSPVTH